MQCPVDKIDLVIADRQGIEIDYCPKCRGVWLDRGELDKLIERAAQAIQPTPAPRFLPSDPAPYQPPQRQAPQQHQPYQQQPYQQQSYQQQPAPHPKKKESFLGELFDF